MVGLAAWSGGDIEQLLEFPVPFFQEQNAEMVQERFMVQVVDGPVPQVVEDTVKMMHENNKASLQSSSMWRQSLSNTCACRDLRSAGRSQCSSASRDLRCAGSSARVCGVLSSCSRGRVRRSSACRVLRSSGSRGRSHCSCRLDLRCASSSGRVC